MAAESVEKNCTLRNKMGLHARPAAQIVQAANRFPGDVTLEKDGQTVNGKSIMGVVRLAAAKDPSSEPTSDSNAPPAAKIATTGPSPVVATRAAVCPRVFLAIEELRAGVRVKAATPETKRAIRPASRIDSAQDTVPWTRLTPRRRSPASRTTANPPMNEETMALTAPQRAAPELDVTGRAVN